MAFNKREYDDEYAKKHLSQFKVNLKKEEKKKLDEILNEQNISKTEFLRESIFNFKKERGIMMNKYDVANFLKAKEVEKKDYFEEDFAAGHYSTQDTSLEKWYKIEDGAFITTISSDHKYAYIDLIDEDDNPYEDGYISYEDYLELIKNCQEA